jgi:hypothetical protein
LEEESKGEAPKDKQAQEEKNVIDDWEAADSDEIEEGLKDTGDTPTLR